MSGPITNPADTALDYLRRGWCPLSLPAGTKAPLGSDWPNLRLTEADLPNEFAKGSNIGIILGGPSGDLTDIDLDCMEAVTLADYFLPSTNSVFGRPGKLRSHRLYICPGATTVKFQTKADGMMVELRSTGGQTVFPGSIHPSGESVSWERDGEPAQVGYDALRLSVARLAAASLLARHWPAKGTRQDAALALAGGLARGGWSVDDMSYFIEAVAMAAGDEEAGQRAKTAVGTARKGDAPTTGWRRLGELTDPEAVTKAREWLVLKLERGDQPPAWEPPVPFTIHNLPAFPVDALPGWLQNYVEAEAEATQTPPDLAALLSLAVCGGAIAKKFIVFVWEGYREPTNIFTVTALPPGSRKTAVFADVIEPVNEYEREIAQAAAPDIEAKKSERKILEATLAAKQNDAAKAKATERQARINEAGELARELATFQVAAIPRLVADDCSPERLAGLLAEQGGKMAVMAPEGDVFDLMTGRYGNGANFGVYLRGHAGDDLRVDRVGRVAEYIKAPALTVGLAVQPEVLRGLIEKPGLRGKGLLARFLYAIPPPNMGTRSIKPDPVPELVRAAYKSNVRALLEKAPSTNDSGEPAAYALQFSQDAQNDFLEFCNSIEPKLAEQAELGPIQDWASKLPGAVVRLAGILHMAQYAKHQAPWRVHVSVQALQGAIEIAKYLIPHASAAFDEMGADPDMNAARYVLDWLLAKGVEKISKRDLFEGTKGRFKRVKELEPALAVLEEHGYVREAKNDRDGPGRKPSPIFELNPYAQNSQNSQNAPGQNDSANTAKYASNRVPPIDAGDDLGDVPF